MRRKRFFLGASIIAFTLTMTGCSALPTTAGPQPFIIEAPHQGTLIQSGFGPRPGSTPSELVTDFLRACGAGSSDDYATAAQYLLPLAAQTWQPLESVYIYSSEASPHVLIVDSGTVSARLSADVKLRATVDETGIFTQLEVPTASSFDFELSKDQDGEWRIKTLPDGIVVSESSFSTGFQSVNLYFASNDQQTLVADPRWYSRKRLASRLVQGVLDGPSLSLKEAVFSRYLEGLGLPTQGVEVLDQEIRVELVGINDPDAQVRNLLGWEIITTLRQADALSNISISINGIGVNVGDLPQSQRVLSDRAIGLRGQKLVVNESGQWVEVSPNGSVFAEASHPAIGPLERNPIAWLQEDSVVIRDKVTAVNQTIVMNSPTAPSIDQYGWVWTNNAKPGAAITAIEQTGRTIEIPSPLGATGVIRKVMVAADGARVLFIKEEAGVLSLWTAVVMRDLAGDPIGIGTRLSEVLIEDGTLLDASWVGSTTVVALMSEGDSATRLQVAPLGDFTQRLKTPNGVVRVSGGGELGYIYLQNANDLLFSRAGAVWRSLGEEFVDVNYAG